MRVIGPSSLVVQGVTVALKHLPRLRQRGKSLELAMLLWMTGYSYVKLGSTQEVQCMLRQSVGCHGKRAWGAVGSSARATLAPWTV